MECISRNPSFLLPFEYHFFVNTTFFEPVVVNEKPLFPMKHCVTKLSQFRGSSSEIKAAPKKRPELMYVTTTRNNVLKKMGILGSVSGDIVTALSSPHFFFIRIQELSGKSRRRTTQGQAGLPAWLSNKLSSFLFFL